MAVDRNLTAIALSPSALPGSVRWRVTDTAAETEPKFETRGPSPRFGVRLHTDEGLVAEGESGDLNLCRPSSSS